MSVQSGVFHVASFVVAIVLANMTEWFVHRYILHGWGKRKKSYWSFHWHEHHGNSRRNEHIDTCYEKSVFGWHAQGKEALGLALNAILVLPLLWWAPGFVLGIWWSTGFYYYAHKKSHQNQEWARKKLPWHYAHHMGPNQDMNWCVTWPWSDWVMGTREKYVGTEREVSDVAKRLALKERKQAGEKKRLEMEKVAA